MVRLLRQWRVSRTLDQAGNIPAAPRGHDRLVMVHEALRRGGPALSEPAPGSRERILEAVRRESRVRPAQVRRPFTALHVVMSGILLVCGLVGAYVLMAPQALPARGNQLTQGGGPVPVDGGPEEAPGNLLGGGFKLAGLWNDLTTPIKKVTEEAMQAPAKGEAENLVAYARRTADVLLVRHIPVLKSGVAVQEIPGGQ